MIDILTSFAIQTSSQVSIQNIRDVYDTHHLVSIYMETFYSLYKPNADLA